MPSLAMATVQFLAVTTLTYADLTTESHTSHVFRLGIGAAGFVPTAHEAKPIIT